MRKQVIVLPAVEDYPPERKPEYWIDKTKCPTCHRECWLPAGVTAEMVAKYGAKCSECVWGKKLMFQQEGAGSNVSA